MTGVFAPVREELQRRLFFDTHDSFHAFIIVTGHSGGLLNAPCGRSSLMEKNVRDKENEKGGGG